MNANATYQADVVLRNGSTVTLRSPRADDGAALVALSRHLASGSLYSRFSTTPRPPADEIAGMLQASPELQIVLVAESAGALVAVASCHRDDEEPDRAEVTFSVDERMQGRGLGTLLLEALARLAWARAIRTFDAYVLSGNDDMLRVFRDSGFSTTRELQAGVFHVRLELRRSAEHDARAAARSQAAATASMRAFFEPGSVAIIGANRERGKIGSEILHNVIAGGYTGRLYVVHPVASQIEGITGFPRLSAIPGAVELAVIAVPAAHVAGVVDEAIAAGVRALVVISAGFGETGAEGRAREAALVEAARRAGVRMVGPNCMGLINTHPTVRLNATFSPITPPPGRVAMSTQSGALGLAILDYARTLNIGFSTFVSVGNKADVSSNDLIQYWAEDPNTDVILLYLESFGNPRKFSQIARRTGRIKPIVAVKAGRSAVGARAASSHTGALASSDLIVDALFHQSGVIRTTTIEELFDVAALLAHQPIPRGRRVAILTNAGGPGILAADACEAQGLRLPAPTASTVGELRTFLPPAAALGNPIRHDRVGQCRAVRPRARRRTPRRDVRRGHGHLHPADGHPRRGRGPRRAAGRQPSSRQAGARRVHVGRAGAPHARADPELHVSGSRGRRSGTCGAVRRVARAAGGHRPRARSRRSRRDPRHRRSRRRPRRRLDDTG